MQYYYNVYYDESFCGEIYCTEEQAFQESVDRICEAFEWDDCDPTLIRTIKLH